MLLAVLLIQLWDFDHGPAAWAQTTVSRTAAKFLLAFLADELDHASSSVAIALARSSSAACHMDSVPAQP